MTPTLARGRVAAAIRTGRLVRPEQCPACQRPVRPDAHHPDYSKPLEVEWLCRSCHRAHHAREAARREDGTALRRLLRERDWTEADLAAASGVSRRAIAKVRTNPRRVAPRTLEKVARALMARGELMPGAPA